MLIGVWTSHERNMISKVTQMAWDRPGLPITAFQLDSPSYSIAPMPSHRVKLRPSTPSSGTMPKATKKSSAGSTSHHSDRVPRGPAWLRRGRLAAWAAPRPAPGGTGPTTCWLMGCSSTGCSGLQWSCA